MVHYGNAVVRSSSKSAFGWKLARVAGDFLARRARQRGVNDASSDNRAARRSRSRLSSVALVFANWSGFLRRIGAVAASKR
jgi:hypothetical protein